MTNEEFVEEVYYLAHKKGVLNEFRDEVTKIKTSHQKMSLYDAVEIVQRKFNLSE